MDMKKIERENGAIHLLGIVIFAAIVIGVLFIISANRDEPFLRTQMEKMNAKINFLENQLNDMDTRIKILEMRSGSRTNDQ